MKDGDTWLTEADVKKGVSDTTGLKLLDAARARLNRVGLSDEDVSGVSEEEETEGKGPVNVMVTQERVGENRAWAAKDLSNVDPQVQAKMWKSIVRISSEDVCSGTTLIVDRTPTHLYLLASLHLWGDSTFADHLSADFKKELRRYRRIYPELKPSGKKEKVDDIATQPRRRSTRKTAKQTLVVPDQPQVVVEQLYPATTKLEKVLRFSLHRSVCWRSSAAFDLAIFEIAVADDIELVRCETPLKVFDTLSVNVFGFRGALEDVKIGHSYAVIPAKVTGWSRNQMILSSLSAPGLSGSAVVCAKMGVPVGYMGSGIEASAKNERCQSYGFTFHGIPSICRIRCRLIPMLMVLLMVLKRTILNVRNVCMVFAIGDTAKTFIKVFIP